MQREGERALAGTAGGFPDLETVQIVHFRCLVGTRTRLYPAAASLTAAALPIPELAPCIREREFFIDNLLVRVHVIIVMIRWTGLAPWEFEFPFPGSLTSTFLVLKYYGARPSPDVRGGK